MARLASTSRLPRSGNGALAAGALIQAAVGTEFVLAGLNKVLDADYATQFRSFVQASPGATSGPLSLLIQSLVIPNVDAAAEIAKWTELAAGAILLVTAFEVARRRLSAPIGSPHAYEPPVALLSAVAAFVLGSMSFGIFLLEGARLPTISPGFAFGSPIAVELLLVPLALAVAWLEFARFVALRSTTAIGSPAAPTSTT